MYLLVVYISGDFSFYCGGMRWLKMVDCNVNSFFFKCRDMDTFKASSNISSKSYAKNGQANLRYKHNICFRFQ